MTQNPTIYGVCRGKGCGHVWTEEPKPRGKQTTAPTCPSCGLKEWPMFPREAHARRENNDPAPPAQCSDCGRTGFMRRCRTCSREQGRAIFECVNCGHHVV